MTERLSDRDRDELFEHLSVPLQQAVARGDVDLDGLLEEITGTTDAELCPWCARRPVTTQSGLCLPCHRRRLNEALSDRLAALEAQREANVLKTRVRRERDILEPNRVRQGSKAVVA